jgi:hypothetical protein
MAYIVERDGKEIQYGTILGEMDNYKFRWQLNRERILGDQESQHRQPGWRRVGPEFANRDKGAAYLGWKDGQVNHHTGMNVKENLGNLVDEYESIIRKETHQE